MTPIRTVKKFSRRAFLAVSAAGIATAASNRKIVGANERVRVGVIGCGQRGLALMKDLVRLNVRGQRIEIAAICDIWRRRTEQGAAYSNATIHHDWRELIDRSDLDAILIATPDHWHAPMTLAAMKTGKDVYCEAPMTRTILEARAVLETAEIHRAIVQIGAPLASHPAWHAARELIASGKLGAIRRCQPGPLAPGPAPFISAVHTSIPNTIDWQAFLGDAPQHPFDPERYTHWQHYWDYSGDIAGDRNFERLAALLIAIGSETPHRISAAGGVTGPAKREVPNAFMTTLHYDNDKAVVLTSATKATRSLPTVIRGERASLEIDGTRLTLRDGSHTALSTYTEDPGETFTVDAPRSAHHLSEWIDAVRSRQSCTCDEKLGFDTMAAIAASLHAYRKKRSVTYDNVYDQIVVVST